LFASRVSMFEAAPGPRASNPFDAPAIDFSDAETRNSEDFFGSGGGSAPVASAGRIEGDDKYPWQVGFWRSMFDVDTKEVGGRILHSLVPFRRSFIDAIKVKPDLWAPFWICRFVLCVLFKFFLKHADFFHDLDRKFCWISHFSH
jgi:hypothetical protein